MVVVDGAAMPDSCRSATMFWLSWSGLSPRYRKQTILIDDRGANRKTAIDGGCGRRGDARFLQIGNNVLVELVRVVAAVPEANDLDRHRRQQLQCRFTLHALLHVFRQRAGAGDHVAELPGSIGFDGEPRLERSETTGQVRSEIARP